MFLRKRPIPSIVSIGGAWAACLGVLCGSTRSQGHGTGRAPGLWAMNERNISKAEIAKRLKTSRSGVDRLLDPQNTSITLNTMARVAQLLGKRIEFALR